MQRCLCSVLALLAINVIYLVVFGGYDFHFGPIHLVSSGIFKPLRWFSVALVILIALAATGNSLQPEKDSALNEPLFALLLLALTLAAYHQTFAVNFDVFEWDHRDISAQLKRPQDFFSLFTNPQPNGFYRPLTYLSLWFDFALFGNHLWAYHLQNLLIHFLNALVVLKLALELGLSHQAARFAAVLFTVAAINFEAVMWPAARFDLLAALFTMLATLFLLRYQKQKSLSYLALSAICFVLGLLNKESAYAFPVIAAMVLFVPLHPSALRLSIKKGLFPILLIALITALVVALRFAIGFGGYRDYAGASLHFNLTGASIFSFLVNTLGLTQFAVNTSVPLPLYVKLAVAGFVLAALITCITTKPSRRLVVLLVALVLVSAVPVLALLGWIRPSLQNTRFLYLPAVWMSLVLAHAVSNISRGVWLVIAAIVLSNGLAAHHNVSVYKEMFERTDQLAAIVFQDQQRMPARTVYLVGLAEAPNGVFYFPAQLHAKLKKLIPEGNIVIVPLEQPTPAAQTGERIYKWDGVGKNLVLQP